MAALTEMCRAEQTKATYVWQAQPSRSQTSMGPAARLAQA